MLTFFINIYVFMLIKGASPMKGSRNFIILAGMFPYRRTKQVIRRYGGTGH